MERAHNLSIENLVKYLEIMESEARDNALDYWKHEKTRHYQSNYFETYLATLFPKLDSAKSDFEWMQAIDLYIFKLYMLLVLGFKKINHIKKSDENWFGIDKAQDNLGIQKVTRCFTDAEKLEPRYSRSMDGREKSIRCIIKNPSYVFYTDYVMNSDNKEIEHSIHNGEIMISNLDFDLSGLISKTADKNPEWDYDIDTIEEVQERFCLNDFQLVPSVLSLEEDKKRAKVKVI